jgi:hypothetical protein
LLGVAIGFCLVGYAFVLFASPSPFIDVFRHVTEGADHLLAGRDPYSQTYRDLYGGVYDYRPGIPYWPGTLLVATVSRALTGDVRWGYFAASSLAVVALYRLARTMGASVVAAELIVLAWLVRPVGPLVLEQGWVDPLLTAAFAWLALSLVRGEAIAAGVALGLAVAFKQYGAVGGAVALVFAWRARGARSAIVSGAVAAMVFALLTVPFAVWDLRGLYEMTVAVPARMHLRLDALTLLVPLSPWLGEPWPTRITAVVGAASLALSCVAIGRSNGPKIWDLAIALLFAYGLLFLFAKQAFCNYHDFASFFALLYVTTRVGRATDSSSGRPSARTPTPIVR